MVKKYLLWFLGIFGGLFALLFIMLFTPIGNGILKPIIQSQINKNTPIALDLETFELRISRVAVEIRHKDSIVIELKGDFSLFTQSFDIALNVDAKDIAVFGELVDTPLQGGFVLNANAKGDMSNVEITLNSDIAKSATSVNALLKDLSSIQSIKVVIKDLQLGEILAMLGKKPYIGGALSLVADVSGTDNFEFSGEAHLGIKGGNFSQSAIKKDFEIDIPKTDFTTKLQVDFQKDIIAHTFVFDSNIGVIQSDGTTKIDELSTTSAYKLNFSELSPFSPLVGSKVRGAFITSGEVNGKVQENLVIEGSAGIGFSNAKNIDQSLRYVLNLVNLAPDSAILEVKKLSLDRALWMIYQPQYVDADLDAKVAASDLSKKPNANVVANIKGKTKQEAIKKEFDMDMPETPFAFDADADIKKLVGVANAKFSSPIALFEAKKIALNLENFAIESPYNINLPDLTKLKFATGMKLYGDIKANGNFKKTESLYVDFNTKSLGGVISGKLDDSKIEAKLDSVNALNFLKMLGLKQSFNSMLFGNFHYDTNISKGKISATSKEGKILENDLTKTLKQYLKFDLAGEVYNDISLNADINQALINSNFSLQSRDTKISSQKTNLNLDNQSIDSKISLQVKDSKVDVYLTNAISNPTMRLDAKDLLIDTAKKAINKEVDKFLESEQGKKAQQAIDKAAKDIQKEGDKLLKQLFR